MQLTENLISKGVDGLVGIEELTDYKLVKDYGPKSILKVGRELHAQCNEGRGYRLSMFSPVQMVAFGISHSFVIINFTFSLTVTLLLKVLSYRSTILIDGT